MPRTKTGIVLRGSIFLKSKRLVACGASGTHFRLRHTTHRSL